MSVIKLFLQNEYKNKITFPLPVNQSAGKFLCELALFF
jgi:hypothetical protein